MFALLLALVLGPEQPASVPYRVSNLHNSQSIATNGSDVAVAWADNRSGSSDVYTARLTSGGQVRAITPLTYGANASHVKVIHDGASYRVFWSDAASEWTLIDAAAVSGGVVLLEQDRQFRLALRRAGSTTRDVFQDRAAAIGVVSNAVVWMVGDGSDRIVYAERVDVDGTRIGLPIEVARGVSTARVAPGLIACSNGWRTTITRIAPNGVLNDVAQLPYGSLQGFAATGDGGFILIKDTELLRYDANGILASREQAAFTPEAATFAAGHVVAIGRASEPSQLVAYAAGQLTEIAPQYEVQTDAAIASDGSDVLTLWRSSAAPPIAAMPYHTIPALSFDGDHYTAAFTTINGDVAIATLGPGGVAVSGPGWIGITDDDHAVVGGWTAAWRNTFIQNRVAYWTFLDRKLGAPNLEPGVAKVAAWSGTFAVITVLGDLVVIPEDGPPRFIAKTTGTALALAEGLVVYQDADGLVARFAGNPVKIPLAQELIGQPAAISADGAFFVTWASAEGVFVARIAGNAVTDVMPVSADGRNPAIAAINGGVVIAYERRDAALGYTARVFTRTLVRPRQRAASH